MHGLVDSSSLARLYSSADIFVFPSHHEGFGIVLAEAMNAGLPIIAAESGPVTEIIAVDENALVVPAADSLALAEAIHRLARDDEKHRRFARRSRELAERLPRWRDTCEIAKDAIRRVG
jgi:glycosyltransferase involved in cell wall biosynthesis